MYIYIYIYRERERESERERERRRETEGDNKQLRCLPIHLGGARATDELRRDRRKTKSK